MLHYIYDYINIIDIAVTDVIDIIIIIIIKNTVVT